MNAVTHRSTRRLAAIVGWLVVGTLALGGLAYPGDAAIEQAAPRDGGVTSAPNVVPGSPATPSAVPLVGPSPVEPASGVATPAAAGESAPPACSVGDEVVFLRPGADWTLARLDTHLRLPRGYAPLDLVPVSRAGLAGGGRVRQIVIADLRDLERTMAKGGLPLSVRSAFRTEERQAAVFGAWVAASGRRAALRSSARPGHSEHQLGTTVDFSVDAGAPWSIDFGATPTGRWLAAHAAEFGFVMSYPPGRSEVTCYHAEPWHFRWIGRDRAAAVAASGLTLREWLFAHPAG